ncbi:MAG: hypothetical protein KC777_14840 [Cyanobacteria bacterium HKST-UBA02]|nr:hypothetical protein [Cyanobacteria bacterium HKST-UBA02]
MTIVACSRVSRSWSRYIFSSPA